MTARHVAQRAAGVKIWPLAPAVLALLLLAAAPARADIINVVDVIPVAASSESSQNSEPSLAVNPLNPNQMISSSFTATFTSAGAVTPYWMSTNGGTIWSGFGTLNTLDKTLAWRQDGVAALTATLNPVATGINEIQTFQSGATNFGAPINTFNPNQGLDQPWIRTGPSGQTYTAYNNLSNAGGRTASIIVSSNNGVTYGGQVTLETVNPTGGQDAPSVRTAVNGSTVYAAFTRWGGVIENDANGVRFGNSEVVVVKSTNSGASFNSGTSAATGVTGYFANALNTSLTLGQNRSSSDLAIAVDPKNANHVVVAYGDAPGANGSGLMQLHVTESIDGGATWANKLTTAANVRSGLPALSILANGTIGLLYGQYNPQTNQLSQHFLTTTNGFATTNDSLLGTQSNALPLATFSPYIGDFFDLTSVNNTFYGIFSASNADNGTDALFASATFQRNFRGTPGDASFGLQDLNNRPVDFSIDPFVFSVSFQAPPPPPVPEPGTLLLLGVGLTGLTGLRWVLKRRT